MDPIQPTNPPVVQQNSTQTPPTGETSTTRSVITVLLLIFFNLIGLIVMWFWTKWQTWIKVLITMLSFFYFFFSLAILGVLASVVIIAVDPLTQLAKARNVGRQQDILKIHQGLQMYKTDNQGQLPPGSPAPGQSLEISSTGTGFPFCTALYPKYIQQFSVIPNETDLDSDVKKAAEAPTDCNNYDTDYILTVATDSATLTISAPQAELKQKIEVTQ